ncbi:MAG: alkaline phosphatase family protein [Candidatus Tumulicola sp.]
MTMIEAVFKRAGIIALALIVVACSSRNAQAPFSLMPQNAPPGRPHASAYPITHVVVIMQENRSFDNMFYAFPGAETATFGYGHGVKYTMVPKHLKFDFDLNHYHYQFLEDFDSGQNDGWDRMIHGHLTTKGCNGTNWVNEPSCWVLYTDKNHAQMPFTYVYKSEIQPYWTMASQYTLGDHNFGSTNGPSFGEHQELIAGQDGHASEVPSAMPWGCDKPSEHEYYLHYGSANPPAFPPAVGHEVWGPDPCFTYKTVANLLDSAHVSWRWYKQPDPPPGMRSDSYNPLDSYWLDAFDAIKAVRYGRDYQNVVTPDMQVLTDIADANMAQVSWVMPHQGASDHPGGGSGDCGPAWVTAIVNAIGQSQYWNSTAIVISWDEWGGWFDHVLPTQYPNLKTGTYEGLGYRTPLIVISPYAKTHYISKSQHETASSLHFIEKMFGLPSLKLDDARADAYDDVFDFSQQPTKFKKIPQPANYQTCLSQQDAGPEIDY